MLTCVVKRCGLSQTPNISACYKFVVVLFNTIAKYGYAKLHQFSSTGSENFRETYFFLASFFLSNGEIEV